MDTALSLLLALPATRPLIFVLLDRLGGVVVTNALVTTVEQLVVGNIVVLDVLLDLFEGPVGKRVDLDQASLVNLNDIEVTTLATLAATTSSKDSVDVEFAVGTLGRLNLGHPVVELVVLLPETGTVLLGKFFLGLQALGLEDMDVDQRILLADTIDQIQGLFEVVEGVEEDEINHLGPGHVQLGEHVQGHETGETESGGLVEVRQRGHTPSQDICVYVSQLGLETRERGNPC